MKKLFLLVTLGVFLCAGSAMATPVDPFDWDTAPILALYQGPISGDFMQGEEDIGDIENTVYVFEEGSEKFYVYVHEVVPGMDNVSGINTAFGIPGFVGFAGYSYSDAVLAAGGGDGSNLFSIELDPADRLGWYVEPYPEINVEWWDSGEDITFFFTSFYGPGMGEYIMSYEGGTGTAESYAPAVPEPATMLLLGSGLIGLAALGRKKFFNR